jgi:hypothetical protein
MLFNATMRFFHVYAVATRKPNPLSNGHGGMDTIAGLLASLMEVVRTTVACECVYVRAMVIKALIWMQNPHESFEELKSIIACELSDPAWPSSLLNDVLLTLHARFKVLDPFQCLYYIYSAKFVDIIDYSQYIVHFYHLNLFIICLCLK